MNPKTTTVPISSISVVDRLRRDLGDINSLAMDIREHGLIQPVVINQDLRLIAGGRRLTACKSLGWTDIPVVFLETLDEAHLTELELAENLERHDISWQERVLALSKVHSLKSTDPGWGQRQTGKLFNVALGKVNYMLQLAREIKRAPDGTVAKADTVTDATRLVLQREEDALKAELAKRLATVSTTRTQVASVTTSPVTVEATLTKPAELVVPLSSMFLHKDALSVLGSMDQSVDHIICDPPYAIDMAMLDQNNPHGGMTDIARIEETHQVGPNIDLLKDTIHASYAAVRAGGFFIMWCDIMRWQYLYDTCIDAGFKVQRWPITWVKTHQCMNQMAQYNFTKNTEIAIVCRKGLATMVLPASTCTIAAANDPKIVSHPFAKPFAVWEFIAKHVSYEGQTIFDPFAGSCSSLKSFLRMKRKVLGCEVDEKHHTTGILELQSVFRELHPNPIFV